MKKQIKIKYCRKRMVLLSIVLLSFMAGFGQCWAAYLSDGLIAYYPFNGNSNDESGNGHTGFPHGNVSYLQGKKGQAAYFDGQGAYVETGKFSDVWDNWTVTLWFQAATLNETVELFEREKIGTYYDLDLSIRKNTKLLVVETDKSPSVISGTVFSSNKWYHIAVSYDGSAKKLFVNGELDALEEDDNSRVNVKAAINIARHVNASVHNYFRGLIDEVRVYDRALSISEIKQLYNLQNPSGISAVVSIFPASRTVAATAGTTTFAVSNSGSGTMNWTAATGDSWLSLAGGASGTNSGSITVSFAANNTGSNRTGTVTVTAPGAENSPQILLVTQSRENSLAGVLDHFEFSDIPSPQTIDESFPITVRAVDVSGNPVAYNGRADLFSSLGRVDPTALFFSFGTATAEVTLYDIGKVYLRCAGSGITGRSGCFAVNGVCQCVSDVTGKLVDNKREPVVGARVKLYDAVGLPAQEVVSNSSGKYQFSKLPCGKYLVKVEVLGGSWSQEIGWLTADGQPVAIGETRIFVNMSRYGTPVILVPGILGSSSTKGSFFPGLSREKPDHGLHIHLKDTGSGDYLGWESLDSCLRGNFLVFDCPWDWRLGADEAVREYLIPAINKALKRSTTGKVHIVAHSMGGLLARALIQSDIVAGDGEKYYRKIDKLVMIGTPHLGSCNAYYIWEGGDPKGLDDLVSWGPWVENTYSNTIKRLWNVYDKGKWDDKNREAIKRFIVEDVSGGYDKHASLRQLVYVKKFLRCGKKADQCIRGGYWAVTSAGNENRWLKALNKSPHIERMTSDGQDTSRVRTLMLVGERENTIQLVKVNSSETELYPDGEPIMASLRESRAVVFGGGDGTVTYDSASWPIAKGIASSGEAVEGKHAELPGKFNEQIYHFLTGLPRPKTAVSPRTESASSSMLSFAINNHQRLLVTDPSGNSAGSDPGSGALRNEIAGAYISFDGSQGVVSLPEPAAGDYTVTFFGDIKREFALEMSCQSTGESTFVAVKEGFSPDEATTLTVTLNPLADPPLEITPMVAACAGLESRPYADGGRLCTRLRWHAVAGAAAYRIYGKSEIEPYFLRLAEIDSTAAPEYDTGESWRDSAAVLTRVYVVTALDAAGHESFFSDKVYNDDRDHDNLTDLEEAAEGTEVDNPDTDGDGLLDGDEVKHYGSRPDLPDTDGDGYDDFGEIKGHSEPRYSSSIPDLHVDSAGYCNGEYYCFPTIGGACRAAGGGELIVVGQGDYREDLLLNEGKDLTITGGWNGDYSLLSGNATLYGSLIIDSGCLTIKKLIISGQ